jgi:hypothetical protein
MIWRWPSDAKKLGVPHSDDEVVEEEAGGGVEPVE